MPRIVLSILLLLLSLAATASADEWTRADTATEAVVLATLAADYLQTRQIVLDGKENNPVMGLRGDRLAPEAYFPIAAGLHVAIVRLTPRPYRSILQGLTIGFQLAGIRRNWHAGYAVSF
jgi:hypothetical protein